MTWFSELARRGLGPHWYASVSINDTCGWDMMAWMRARPLPGFRVSGPLLGVDSALGLKEAHDLWHRVENDNIQVHAHRTTIVLERRGGPANVSEDSAIVETRLLASIARDPSLGVLRSAIWAGRGTTEPQYVLRTESATELAAAVGEAPFLEPDPAAAISAAGERIELDDDAWLAWNWAGLLYTKRESEIETLAGRGGIIRGAHVEELASFVADVRSRLGMPRPPLLPAAFKRATWQWGVASRLAWMLGRVWNSTDPPRLLEVLSLLDSFARRARENATPFEVTLRDGLGPAKYARR